VPDEPGLTRVQVELLDDAGRAQAMNFCYVESVGECGRAAGGDVVVRLLAGDCAADFVGAIERGEVEGEVHLLAAEGPGRVEYAFALPADLPTERIASVEVVLEASSRKPGAPQTGPDKWHSQVHLQIGGEEVGARVLTDQPADSRGALSHMHGFRGRYGELVRAEVPAHAVRPALERGIIRLTMHCGVHDERCGGLTIYGSRAGRYPCDVCLVVHMDADDAKV